LLSYVAAALILAVMPSAIHPVIYAAFGIVSTIGIVESD
jgi:hypothetical protein